MSYSGMDLLTLDEMKYIIDKTGDWILHGVKDYEVILSSEILGVYEKYYSLEDASQLEEVLAYLYETQGAIQGDEKKLAYQYARYLFPYNELDLDIQRARPRCTVGEYTVIDVPTINPKYYNACWLIKNIDFDLNAFLEKGDVEMRTQLLMWTQWLSTARKSDNAQVLPKVVYELTSSGKYRLAFNLSSEEDLFATFYIKSDVSEKVRTIKCKNYKDYILTGIDLIPEMSNYLGSDITRLFLPDTINQPKS